MSCGEKADQQRPMARVDLVLPEPARSLWRRTRSVIRTGLGELGDDVGYRIGGGTILAARWGHRTSFDIDLTLDRPANLRRLEGGPLDTRLRALGATCEFNAGIKMYDATFRDAPQNQAIQIWAKEPSLYLGDSREVIDGHEETVLCTAQILRGKLERADMGLARDVYDIVTARQRDPRSLEIAANSMPHKRLEEAMLAWTLKHGRIARNGREDLFGLPEGGDRRHESLARRGKLALAQSMYETFEIRVERAVIVIEAGTYGGDRRSVRTGAPEAADAFQKYGIDGHIGDKGPTADEIREYAIAVSRQDRGDTLIFRARDDEAVAWRTGTASLSLPVLTETPGAP